MNCYEVERMTEQEIKDMLGWAEDDVESKVLTAVMALCGKVAELRRRVDTLESSPNNKLSGKESRREDG